MYVGKPVLCLRVADLEQAIRFYEAIGIKLEPGEGVPGQSVFVRRGNFCIMLMQSFGEDSVTFRGATATDVHEHLRSVGFEMEDQPRTEAGDESFWMTHDPDGHGVFFNTFDFETRSDHKQALVSALLRNTEQDLIDLGADDTCLSAYRGLLAKLGSPVIRSDETNKQSAISFYETAYLGNPRKAVERYVGEEYIQHNPVVGNGKEAFIAYFERMAEEYPNKKIAFVRAIAESDLVALHTHQVWPDGDEYVTMDFFRFDPLGKIVEHWDSIQGIPASSLNGNSMY